MSTRARIGILESDDTVTSIYSHWDGYISHHGPLLRDHYKTEEKVRALIALGDVSSLGAEIGTKHDFDNAPEGVCNFYGRDRGEKDVAAQRGSLTAFSNEHMYNYLFVPAKSEWLFVRRGNAPITLDAVIEQDSKDEEA